MKKLFYTLFVVIGLSTFGFAQEKSNTVLSNGATELTASKVSGDYVFQLPENVTAEDVKSSAEYYTHYFSVSFDENSHKVSITMVENTSKNRFVIARFLTACKMEYIQIDNDALKVHDFIEQYLK